MDIEPRMNIYLLHMHERDIGRLFPTLQQKQIFNDPLSSGIIFFILVVLNGCLAIDWAASRLSFN